MTDLFFFQIVTNWWGSIFNFSELKSSRFLNNSPERSKEYSKSQFSDGSSDKSLCQTHSSVVARVVSLVLNMPQRKFIILNIRKYMCYNINSPPVSNCLIALAIWDTFGIIYWERLEFFALYGGKFPYYSRYTHHRVCLYCRHWICFGHIIKFGPFSFSSLSVSRSYQFHSRNIYPLLFQHAPVLHISRICRQTMIKCS